MPFRDGRSIRLLRFPRERTFDNMLWCELEVFSLDRNPEFAAVSYAWGDPNDWVEIRCNHSQGIVKIPRSLYNFLTRFVERPRGDHAPTNWTEWSSMYPPIDWIWADAICINQLDTEEKSAQVRLMGRIYQQATWTFVWLGESTWESRMTLDLVMEALTVNYQLQQAGETRKLWELGIVEGTRNGCGYLLYPLHFGTPSFLQKGWFTRKWVIQELAKSYNPVLVFDRTVIHWNRVQEAFDFIIDVEIPVIDPRSLARMQLLATLRSRTRARCQQSLLSLLFWTGSFECTDQRDHVFALLGLATDCLSRQIKIVPDYTIDMDHLLYKTTIQILLSSPRLDILGAPHPPDRTLEATKRSEPPEKSALQSRPSWMLEKKRSLIAMRPFFPLTSEPDAVYSNFNAAPQSLFQMSDLSSDGSKLRLSGYEIGFIERLGDWTDLRDYDKKSLSRRLWELWVEQPLLLSDWETRVCNIYAESTYVFTGESMRDVYWRTLTAGQLLPAEWLQTSLWDFTSLRHWYLHWDRMYRRPSRMIPSSGFLVYLRPTIRILTSLVTILKFNLTDRANRLACWRFDQMTGHAQGRRMFASNVGHIGLAPFHACLTDRIWIVKGCRTPLVLRWLEDRQEWKLIGDCYLHGFMSGADFQEDLCESFWLS